MPPRRTIKLPPKKPEPSAQKLLLAVLVLVGLILLGYSSKDSLNFALFKSSVTETPAPIQSSFTVTSTPSVSQAPSSSAAWLAFSDKPGFIAQDNIPLSAKISEIEKTPCPKRPTSQSICPSGQKLQNMSGTDSCGTYSYQLCVQDAVVAPPPSPPSLPATCTRPASASSCPAAQQMTTKSASDNCGKYTYTVCEPIPLSSVTPSTPPPAPITPTPPPSVHGAAEKYCFDDPVSSMSDDDWALICEAKQRGIISGSKSEKGVYFNPNTAINRAEAAKIITLGILKSLGNLNERHFSSMEEVLKKTARPLEPILFVDIFYDETGQHPWYAPYIALAQREGIISGYPDNTFKPSYSLNHVEGYKIILETARVTSKDLESIFQEAEQKSSRSKDWFAKYTKALELLQIRFSPEYSEPMSRKEFIRITTQLLLAIEL